MNVLIGVPWDREVGGVVSVVDSLATYLRGEGHEVVLSLPWTGGEPRLGRSRLGLPCYHLRLRPPVERGRPIRSAAAFLLHLPGSVRRICRVLRSHDIDVVNVHYPERSAVHYALAARRAGVPLVVSAHGTDLFAGGGGGEVGPWSLRFVLARAASVVCPSGAYADRVRRGASLDPTRVVAIHNGVDASAFDPGAGGRSGDPAPVPSGGGPLELVSVGGLTPAKGHEVTIRAVGELVARGVDARLEIAGSGPARAGLARLAERLGVGGRVTLLGRVERDAVPALLAGSDVFVSASRAESFGLAILEAMAAGLPVVAAAVGGVPEVVADEETGLLVDPGDPRALADAIQSLADDPDARARMGSRGARRVRDRFLVRHMGRRYEAEFARLTEREPPGGRSDRASDATAVGASADLR